MAKSKAFRLAKRPCRLCVGLNGRGEKRGDDERVPACDITLEGVILERDELNSVCQDPSTWECWYEVEGKVIKPRAWLRRMGGTVAMAIKFVECGCQLYLPNDDDPLKYDTARFAKLEFTPMEGGNTEMRLQVQLVSGDNNEALHSDDIMTFFGDDIHAAFTFGKLEEKTKRQQELSLTTDQKTKLEQSENQKDGAAPSSPMWPGPAH